MICFMCKLGLRNRFTVSEKKLITKIEHNDVKLFLNKKNLFNFLFFFTEIVFYFWKKLFKKCVIVSSFKVYNNA